MRRASQTPWRAAGVTLCLAACALAAFGCRGDGRKPVYPVHGKVLVDGKPAHEGFVYFHPADDNDPEPGNAFGQIDEKGDFALSTYVSGDGAPSGNYVITIEWRERSGLLKNNFEGKDRLGMRYADPKKSEFRFTVEKKPLNEVPPFELSLKGS
jgi:hypothetical protein